MGEVTPLRRWRKTEHGFEYVSGKTTLGYVLTTDYGTVCWGGQGLRGTAERVDLAKLCVEDLFKTESAMTALVDRARAQLRRERLKNKPSLGGYRIGDIVSRFKDDRHEIIDINADGDLILVICVKTAGHPVLNIGDQLWCPPERFKLIQRAKP